MPDQPAQDLSRTRAPRSRVNALHWVGGAAAFGWTLWWWNDFSGPFRWLIDAEVALTGRFYWEPLAVGLLLTGLLLIAVVVAALLNPIVPRFKARTWAWLLLVAGVLGTIGALGLAWSLWTAPEGPTRRNPPIRVVDLDRLDAPTVPFGPVRVIGRMDRRELVKLRREPRGSNAYQPLAGLHRNARDMPVPVLVSCYSRYSSDCIPRDARLEGWLSPGAFDDRESYRLRRAGVLRTPHFYMLHLGLPTRDSYIEISARDRSAAIDILLCFGFVWLTVIISWILGPRSALPAKAAPRAPPVTALPSTSTPEDIVWLLPPIAGAFAFVFLSALGVLSALFQLLNQILP